MRFVISPKCIALLVVCLILSVVAADAHAYIYVAAVAAWLAIDLGLAYANRSAVAHGDPSLVTGSAGVIVGTFTTISGVAVLVEAEEPLGPAGVTFSLFFAACGVASVYFGGRAISAAVHKDDVAQDGRNVRLVPILSLGDRSERQIGLVVEVSY
jgi:hypothetical protein